MKAFALILVCSLACVACTRTLKTLSDGQPGYVIVCDVRWERCMDELERLCRGMRAAIISERVQEVNRRPNWIDTDAVHPKFNNTYVVEARCIL